MEIPSNKLGILIPFHPIYFNPLHMNNEKYVYKKITQLIHFIKILRDKMYIL